MKILILISGLFFSGGLFSQISLGNPMDTRCVVRDEGSVKNTAFIKELCERNNILFMHNIKKQFLMPMIARWCRHDREINFQNIVIVDEPRYRLTCVLYSNTPRGMKLKIKD